MNNLREQLAQCETISDFLLFWFNNISLLQNANVMRLYYRNFLRNFCERMQSYYNSQSFEVLRAISTFKRPLLLDVGCGCGSESLWFSMQGARVVGLDVVPEHIEVAQERKKTLEKITGEKFHCDFSQESVLDFNAGEKFDIIWMEQAFHHIEPRKGLLNKLPQMLNDGGFLVISESNAWNPLIQANLLRLRGTRTVCEISFADDQKVLWGNERIITPFSLTKKLNREGLSVEGLRYFRILPSGKKFDKLHWLEKRWPKILIPGFTHYNMVAIKK